MRLWRIILTLIILLALAACEGKEATAPSQPTPDPQLERLLDPAKIETDLSDFLTQEFGLTGVSVDYQDGLVKILLQQPEALSDEQVMLLYLGALDAAARFAPGSKRVSLTLAVGGDAFIAIECDTDHILAYRAGEIDLTAFVGRLAISVPAADAAAVLASATTEPAAPTPTPAIEADLSVGEVSLVYSEYFGWQVYATLFNAGNGLAAGVSAQVDIYDASGTNVQSERVEAMQSILAPGSMGALVLQLAEGVQPARAQVSQVESSQILPPWPIKLSLGSVRQMADVELGQVTVVAELHNESEQAVVIESMLGLLMTGKGEVLAHQFDWNYAPQVLPGESTPVSVSWYNISPSLMTAVERIELLPDARLADELRKTSLTISASTRTYLDAQGQPHLVGLLHNAGSLSEQPVLLGSLYDAEGQLLDVNVDWGAPPVLPPGVTVAFDLSSWPMLALAPELVAQAASFDLRVDAYNSYAPQEYEIVNVESYEAEWSLVDGEVVVDGRAVVPSGTYDDVIAILLLHDTASGTILAAGRCYLYGEGSEKTGYAQLSSDPSYNLAGAELLMDVYAVRMLE
jgi:hypothetical protein